MKWYQKLLAFILLIPILLIGLPIYGVFCLLLIPKSRRAYRRSDFYRDYRLHFSNKIMNSPEYRFYSSIKCQNLPIRYTVQPTNGLIRFVWEDKLWLFPDFASIVANEENGGWRANSGGDWVDLDEACRNRIAQLDTDAPNLPVRILVERETVDCFDLRDRKLPDSIALIQSYDDGFAPAMSVIAQTTQELYAQMLEMPDLCGTFTYEPSGPIEDGNGLIHWKLYDGFLIDLGLNSQNPDGYLCVRQTHGIDTLNIHWHPKRLVLGEGVMYMGDEKECPYPPSKRWGWYYLRVREDDVGPVQKA